MRATGCGGCNNQSLSERDGREACLAEIACTTLGLETLATRGRDALDFHELSVHQIKRALEAAYEAGRAQKQ